MSAFIVSEDHLKIVAVAACLTPYFSFVWRGREIQTSRRGIAAALDSLAKENHRSVRARYQSAEQRAHTGVDRKRADRVRLTDREESDLQIVKDPHGVHIAHLWIGEKKYSAFEVYNAVRCYVYQACEHREWPATKMQAMCLALEARYAKEVLSASGLLDKVRWSY